MDQEIRFQANAAKTRKRSILAAILAFGGGYILDNYLEQRFPSLASIFGTVLVFIGVEFYPHFTGVRALSISPSGISLERWVGWKVLRLTWSELVSVEVRRSSKGPVWTFCTKSRGRIHWRQAGFDGDKRQALEQALTDALREHRVRLN